MNLFRLLWLLGFASAVFATDRPTDLNSVQTMATVQENPPRITLSWVPDGNATSYEISRRTMDSGWQSMATVGGGETSWSDGSVGTGTRYEYKLVKRTSAGYTGYGYLASGIRLPALDNWGKIILVVEASLAGPLSSELNQLQSDLTGEGWTVVRQQVSMSDSPQSVRQMIQSIYNSDPASVRAVFLFGHVPVPYSGNINPDGHPNHQGAWPADSYYADVDGNWTDAQVNTTTAERDVNWNVPGDGRLDQSVIPSTTELMVGRVDMYNMTCYANKPQPRSEMDLMRQYVAKDHAFRFGQWDIQKRGVMCDNFADKGDDPISSSAWRSWPGFFGAQNISRVPWDGYLPATTAGSYLWSYASGGGSYYYSTGVATSDDFALNDVKVVFTMWLGSYFGDWNNESNFLRAALGSGYVLTSTYTGAPHTLYFPMAMGEPIGYCIRLTQNNATNSLYEPWVQGTSQVHISLLGDPTLRLSPVKPASSLSASAMPGTALLNWSASPDTGIAGYYVYRATASEGPYTRVTDSLVTGTTYSDSPAQGSYYYMVRAIKLEQSDSGTYLNPSQGIFTSATVQGSAAQAPAAPVLQGQADSFSQVSLSWNNVSGALGYKIERQAGGGEWQQIADLGNNSYSDPNLSPSTAYSYRVRAYNATGASDYSAAVQIRTPDAPPQTPAAPVLLAQAVSDHEIDLQWNEVANARGYRLDRRNSDGTWKQIAELGTAAYADDNLSASTSYSYRVRAFNDAGESPNSSETSAVTLPPPQPPVSPLNLALRLNNDQQIILTVSGNSGQRFSIQSSRDLVQWQELTAGDLTGSSVEITLPPQSGSQVFIRTVSTQ